MSINKKSPPFTRKQLTIIFKIAFLEAMALSIIMPSVQSSGEVKFANGASFQSGEDLCTSFIVGSTNCTNTVFFPTPFPSAPTVIAYINNSCICTDKLNSLSLFDTRTFFALTSLGQTWTNMPIATTEIFGDTTHRVSVNIATFAAVSLSATFTVYCITGSTSATATLKAQYSTNGGSTWTTPAQAGINIAAANCPNILTSGGFVGLANLGSSVQFRLIGLNGGGIGDNPVFSTAQIEFRSANPTFIIATQIQNPFPTQFTYITFFPTGITTTSFPIQVDWIAIWCPPNGLPTNSLGSCSGT